MTMIGKLVSGDPDCWEPLPAFPQLGPWLDPPQVLKAHHALGQWCRGGGRGVDPRRRFRGHRRGHLGHLNGARVQVLQGVEGAVVPAAEHDGQHVDGGHGVVMPPLGHLGQQPHGRPLAPAVVEELDLGRPGALVVVAAGHEDAHAVGVDLGLEAGVIGPLHGQSAHLLPTAHEPEGVGGRLDPVHWVQVVDVPAADHVKVPFAVSVLITVNFG